MNYLKIDSCDLNNGIGCRVTLWVSGCDLYCYGCHNYESWNFCSGNKFDESAKNKLFNLISSDYIDGLSILGGEPLHEKNIDDVLSLCEEVKSKFPNKDIWIWTGYKIEDIRKIPNCDIIIDGRYDKNNPTDKKWRGSDNQRMFSVKNGKLEQLD